MNLWNDLRDFFRTKPAHSGPVQNPTPASSPPDVAPASRRISLVEELRGELTKECYEFGYDTSRKSKRRTADQAVLKALEALAESKARKKAEAMSQFAIDKLLRDLSQWETMLEQRVVDRDGAANKLHVARQALAALPEPGKFPEISPLTLHGTTLWFTASLAPNCRDLLTGFDPQMRWLFGIAGAFAISVAVVNGILPDGEPDLGAPVKESRHHGAMIAGLLLGLAFLALRLASAHTNADLLLAVGLALMEMGAVVLIERKAKPLFAEIDTWRERANARRIATTEMHNVELELQRRQNLIDEAEQAITHTQDALEHNHAASDAKALIAIATNAMRAGYARGIAENAADLGTAA